MASPEGYDYGSRDARPPLSNRLTRTLALHRMRSDAGRGSARAVGDGRKIETIHEETRMPRMNGRSLLQGFEPISCRFVDTSDELPPSRGSCRAGNGKRHRRRDTIAARGTLALHFQTRLAGGSPSITKPVHLRHLRLKWIEVSDSGRKAEPTTSFLVIFVNFCKSCCCV